MIEPGHRTLSIVRQCKLASLCRSSVYYRPRGESGETLMLMRLIDEQYLRTPWYGSRQMARYLGRLGHTVGRKRARRLMRLLSLVSLAPKPNTSRPKPGHPVYPYLLRDLRVERANQVWCTDITYIPMRHGFLYCLAIMDWFSRRVLSWCLSNTLDTEFCLRAFEDAVSKYGTPEIFNTDQGAQFTSAAWTDALKDRGIPISMDGKGRWLDNVFIERLWRSLKYECVYLKSFDDMPDAKTEIGQWMDFYNTERPHSALRGMTPSELYSSNPLNLAA